MTLSGATRYAVGAIRHDRAGNDFFPTPPWATRCLFEYALPAIGVHAVGTAWEPACGAGHMAEVIKEYARGAVSATDLVDRGYGQAPVDFLRDPLRVDADWIITNPPFKAACEFALQAIDLARVGAAMFVRMQWIEGVGRYRRLFRNRPPTLLAPFVERVPLLLGRWDPDGTTATGYAWFVWLKAAKKEAHQISRVFWIPPGSRRKLTHADDRARFAPWSLKKEDASLFDC